MEQDRKLIERILKGDRKAFQSLIESYQRLVSHVVFRMITGDEDRKEICQDVFMKVYEHLPSFQFNAKLSTWIAKIAYNTALNALQKKKTVLYFDGQALDNDSNPEDALTDEQSESPDAILSRQEVSGFLLAAIESLPVQYRTILTLYHLDEMSYAEIEAITNLPEGTVKNYLFRARKLLKERLLETYQIEELWG
jgi:RNA polymerase sigma factor (sigma-70 family)